MSARKSLIFSIMDRYASLAISIVSSMVIARLLTPAEIGIFSVAMVLLTFVASLRDMGAGLYLLQERELTTDRIRAVWSVQLAMGLGLALLIVLASHPAAVFYDEPSMRDIMLIIALNYAINPFGSLTYAWLMREMRFDSVALMRFSAALSGALVSIWLAWNGFGPISLAYGSLASTAANALMAIFFRPRSFPWMPGFGEIRRVIAFGSKVSFGNIVGVVSGGAPELFLGKFQDLAAAGFYSRANGLVQMFNRLVTDAVGAVCLPWFSKQLREEGGIVEPFLTATAYVSVVGWFFCIMLLCEAYPIVRLLYGDQWDQSVVLTRLLSVAMAFTVPASLCHIALMSIGAVNVIVRLTLFGAILTVSLVSVGALYGAVGVGYAAIATACIGSGVALWWTSRCIDLPLSSLGKTLLISAKVILPTTVGPLLALWVFGRTPGNLIFPIAVGGGVGVIGFVAGVWGFKHPIKREFDAILVKIQR